MMNIENAAYQTPTTELCPKLSGKLRAYLPTPIRVDGISKYSNRKQSGRYYCRCVMSMRNDYYYIIEVNHSKYNPTYWIVVLRDVQDGMCVSSQKKYLSLDKARRQDTLGNVPQTVL